MQTDPKRAPITLKWPDNSQSSFRGPLGLKDQVIALLKAIKKLTDMEMTQSRYYLNAIRYYGKYLMKSKDIEELKKRLDQNGEILDDPPNEDTVEV